MADRKTRALTAGPFVCRGRHDSPVIYGDTRTPPGSARQAFYAFPQLAPYDTTALGKTSNQSTGINHKASQSLTQSPSQYTSK